MRQVVVLLLSLGLTACSATTPSASTGSRSGVHSDRIVVSELSVSVAGLTAYDVVEQYKSHWLRKRGRTSINSPVPIKVYVDGVKSPYGSISSLREIQAVNVASIERLSAQDAQFEFGLGNVSGALIVRTKRGGE